MALFRDASVKTKLILISLLGSGSALLLVGAVMIGYDLIELRKTLVRRMTVQADIIGANCVTALLFSDPGSAEATLAALKADPRIVWAGLYSADGSLFAAHFRDVSDGTQPLEDSHAYSGEEPRMSGDRLILSRSILFEGKAIGSVLIKADLHEVRASMARDALILTGVLLASLLVALAVSSRLQQYISQPILQLAGIARRVSTEKDYSVRASGDSRDEIGALVAAFNEMLGEIRQQEAALRAAHDGLERRVTERTAQLQAANKELEAFSYSVSHDLRAPVRHIAGFSEMLDSDGEGLTERGRRHVQKISQAASRMGQLIDDLLAFSRMGRVEMESAPVVLDGLLAEVLREAQPDLRGRTIDWHIAPLPKVRGDRAMLRLALANLVANAVKYTGKCDSPRVDIGVAENAGNEVVVFVRDNGVGFDMQYASKLFGVFQRLHRVDEFEGTGIGLANVRRIINRHGGRTWAEGEPGRGATFYFSLPKVEEGISWESSSASCSPRTMTTTSS